MKFDVETGRVNSMVQLFRDMIDEIAGNKNRMYEAIESLDGMWQGQAHDAFLSQVHADNEKMETLIKELKQIAEYMGEARKSYDMCEQEVKNIIACVQI